ncbi:MAG: hypothetical protein KDB00_29645 [Planctomycetales bacterium]|nr:hypothetical protein [Planctomycetales bacterium]
MKLLICQFLICGHIFAAGISPEVHEDNRVTLRVNAPKAEKVLVLGDWLGRDEQLPMTKGDDGIWAATAGHREIRCGWPSGPGTFPTMTKASCRRTSFRIR